MFLWDGTAASLRERETSVNKHTGKEIGLDEFENNKEYITLGRYGKGKYLGGFVGGAIMVKTHYVKFSKN